MLMTICYYMQMAHTTSMSIQHGKHGQHGQHGEFSNVRKGGERRRGLRVRPDADSAETMGGLLAV
jgi:hypothetical protein